MLSKQNLTDIDEGLRPYKHLLAAQQKHISQTRDLVLGKKSIEEFANGYQFFGLNRQPDGWTIREWAPNLTKLFLVGDFNDWQENSKYRFNRLENGVWELQLPPDSLKHGDRYKLRAYWDGGDGWRLPAYAKWVKQNNNDVDFSAVVYDLAKSYKWQNKSPSCPEVPIIYEAHVGMSLEKEKVASFAEFTEQILPKIKQAGYNTVQLMAIAEHPYYASFGYHVTNFFAVSSRFGAPEDFKQLVDTAHGLGLRIIIDLVHSHASSNQAEGLSQLDGTDCQYFHGGVRGHHPAWDSRVFDYAKPEVMHFLLSNCKWWLEEYNIDGFRFDGVTSMIYKHHGLEKNFTSYNDYFGEEIDVDALSYLTLANQLIHHLRPDAITIAEEMSGFPGLAAPLETGGIGFDYRLNMGAPDLWIKTLKERRDEDWDLGQLVWTLSSHRPEEKTINYAESHDQALVGDKTLIFRLIDKEMYWHMDKADQNLRVDRGIALHKLIRLLTAGLNNGGYLNFMGNEFGHPEWIDFPREGNKWSFKHARRQWSLQENGYLKYQFLGNFDRQLVKLIVNISQASTEHLSINQSDHVISFMRGDYLLVFNFSPSKSLKNYSLVARPGSYEIVLSSDDEQFGGQGLIDSQIRHFTKPSGHGHSLAVYLPPRTAIAFKKVD